MAEQLSHDEFVAAVAAAASSYPSSEPPPRTPPPPPPQPAALSAATPQPAFQLLLYPVTDLASGAPSHARYARGWLLSAALVPIALEQRRARQRWGSGCRTAA